MKTPAAAAVALALVLGACTGAAMTTTTGPPATTTTTLTIPDRIETTTTMDPGAADEAATDRLTAAVEGLIGEVEALRGRVFVERPSVLVLDPEAYQARLQAFFDELMASSTTVGKSSLYQAAQLLPLGPVENVLARLDPPSTPVYFDADGFRLVVSGDAAETDPVLRVAAVHELVLALTDQHHDTTETRAALVDAGADDRLRAFDALIEGDATYFQLVYTQGLSADDQATVAAAFAATDTPVVAGLPDFVRAELAFPYDAGVTFVSELVGAAGISAVDQAYRDPPESSEHVLHPERYRRGEAARDVAEVAVEVDGATTTPSASFGEFQLDLLLSLGTEPGLVTQAVDGWNGDQYQLIESDAGFAFALTLAMDSDEDAIEVVGGLIAHARGVLEAGDGVEAAGGLLWDTDTHYVFIDRIGDGLIYVLATDAGLGRQVRSQLRVP